MLLSECVPGAGRVWHEQTDQELVRHLAGAANMIWSGAESKRNVGGGLAKRSELLKQK